LKPIRAYGFAVLLACFAVCAWGCSSPARGARTQEVPAPPEIQFVGAWGSQGIGPGLLNEPRSIAADDFAAVYLADVSATSRFINKFTRGGHPLQSFEPLVQLRNPCAATVDRGGAIYILDCGAAALYVFKPEGNLLHVIRGGLTVAAKPASVTVDDSGRIYVAEAGPKHILVYTPLGRSLGALRGAASGPISGDAVAASPDGGIYVADPERRTIERISSQGSVDNSWTWSGAGASGAVIPASGSENAAGAICYLAVAPKFVVLFTGPATSATLHVFTLDGQEKRTAQLSELDPSLTNISVGGSAATPDGEVLVLDTAVPRVLRFRLIL